MQEPKGEYSHLDPSNAKEAEAEAEKEEDIYEELGDLDGNDLMQFAYQIATGMVCESRLESPRVHSEGKVFNSIETLFGK